MTLTIAPSKRRILEMDNKTLVANYALIVHKASSLSSTQRKMVKELVEYRIHKGTIKGEDVANEVAMISQAVKDGIGLMIAQSKEEQEKHLQEIMSKDEEIRNYEDSTGA